MINFETLPEYNKDLKRLLKKYRTLESDLEVVKKVLKLKPDGNPPFSFPINNLGITTCVVNVETRLIASLLSIIYAYFEDEQKIVFVELYHKNEKENEDRDRILEYFR